MDVSASVIKNALKGISTDDRKIIAENVGISLRTLLSAASGKTQFSMDTMAKLSKELNVDLFVKYFEASGWEIASAVQEPTPEYKINPVYTTLNFTVRGSQASFANFGDFISDVRKLAKDYKIEVV